MKRFSFFSAVCFLSGLAYPCFSQAFETSTTGAPKARQRIAKPIKITVGHLPPSVLKALTKDRLPEGLGLYSVTRCVSSASDEAARVPGGLVAQAMGSQGLAVVDRPLAQLAVERMREKRLGFLLPVANAAVPVGISVFGWIATEGLRLSPWTAVAATGGMFVFQTLSKLLGEAKSETRKPLAEIGVPWLSDEVGTPTILPGACAPATLTMATYRRGQKEVFEIFE